MKYRIHIPLGKMSLQSIVILLFLLQFTSVFSEEKVSSLMLYHIAPKATDKQWIIYEDADFKMVRVNYGTAGAQSKPGFYIFRKTKADWVRLEKVSTKSATFGRSPTLEEVKKAKKSPPSIGWDFRHLSKLPIVAFPLTYGGFLFFPDKVKKDEIKQDYTLHFNSSWEIPGVETIFRLSINDLQQSEFDQ